MKDPSHILITGASSGLGAALALHYARAGRLLSLHGRDRTRLEDVASRCRAQGAATDVAIADVADREAMSALAARAGVSRPLDLVIANAGISAGTGGPAGETGDQARRIFEINVTGVLNTVDAVLPAMRSRGQGQIAIVSSLASFSGWSGAPAYSASKAAVRFYGEALRGALAGTGVGVSVICPGFIRTPMTDVNPYPMPFLMEADRAAACIARGLAAGRGRIAFPWPAYMAAGLIGLCPPALSAWMMRALPRKPSSVA